MAFAIHRLPTFRGRLGHDSPEHTAPLPSKTRHEDNMLYNLDIHQYIILDAKAPNRYGPVQPRTMKAQCF